MHLVQSPLMFIQGSLGNIVYILILLECIVGLLNSIMWTIIYHLIQYVTAGLRLQLHHCSKTPITLLNAECNLCASMLQGYSW